MAVLSGSKIIVLEKSEKDPLIEKGYGEKKDASLLLSFEEALYLLEKKKIIVEDKNGKKLKPKDLINAAKEKNFYNKYLVFKDLRDRGLVTKTGFKFGYDFRVYPRGKKMGEAHTQWVINVKGQEKACSWAQFSRMVRMAGNLRTSVLQAVVDSEGQVNYYEIKRVTP